MFGVCLRRGLFEDAINEITDMGIDPVQEAEEVTFVEKEKEDTEGDYVSHCDG